MEETHVEDEKMENNEETENLKIKNTVLDNFRQLTKEKEKLRTKAGVNLVKYLVENQENETEFKYALGRLIRGLGSSTANARCGFYSTFMPLLNLSDISVEQILQVVEKELHKGKSNSKSENADVSMGHILVCTAIIRSGLFLKSSEDDQKKVLDCVINAGKVRSYLLFPAYELLLDLDEKISKDVFQSLLMPVIKPQLEQPLSEYNLDSFYFLIMLLNRYPKLIGKQIVKKISDGSILITEDNLEKCANILLSIPRISSLEHPVYELFGKMLVKTPHTIELIKHMDKALSKYNKNKHLVIINFLTIIMKNMEEPNDLPQLLEDNFIRQTITVFRQIKGNEKDYQLKKLTYSLFDTILEVLKKDDVKDKTKISILKKLLFHPGTFIFEKITKSKLIQHITMTLKNEGVKKLANIYKKVVMLENEKFNADTSETFQNNDRLYAANLLVKLLCHRGVHEENEWKCEQLKFFMRLGLTKQPKVGVELASSLKETFFRSLDLKLSKLEDLSTILLEIFNEIDTHDLEMRSPLTEELNETWLKAKEIINQIQSKKTKKIKLVFQILFLHLSLQLFNDVKLAKDSLEELFSCYERVKKKNKEENENDPAWIEVVVELFLSLLSHNSSLLRTVVKSVFPHLCKYLNAATVHQILSVLDPNNEDNPLTNRGDDSDDDESSDEDEDESEIKEEEESDDDEEDCSDDDDDEDMDATKTDKLRTALQVALMQNMENNEGESDIDLDQIDEEQGEKLDKVLGAVFMQFKSKKGKSKKQDKNEETLTHFRIRALDLIEIYLDSNPSMLLTLEIMLSLLQLLEFSIKDNHQKPLQDRVRSCLKNVYALKKFTDCTEVTDKTLCDMLGSLFDKETRNSVILQVMGNEISQCCLFIIRCSQILINTEETPKKVKKHLKQDITKIIQDSLDNYLRRRDCHLPNLIFRKIIQMNWNGNIELLRYLLSVVFDENIRPFMKSQAEEMIRLSYTNTRLLTTCEDKLKEDLIEITQDFLNKCQEFFKNLVENQSNENVRQKFISFLFLVLVAIKKSPLNLETFDWKSIGEIVREYRSFISIDRDTKQSFNKLCAALAVSNIVQMKNTVVKFTSNKMDDETNLVSNNKTEKVNGSVKSKKRKMLNGDSKKAKKIKT